MLQLYKNQVITSISQRHAELRQLELDFYTNNLWTLSSTSTLFAGFSFGQLTAQLPSEIPFSIECSYLFVTALTLSVHLCVLVCSTFCCIWGPGLALRGPHGTRSIHMAVDNLKLEQNLVFALFVFGLLTFLSSNILLIFVYYVRWVAVLSSGILGFFGLATLIFVFVATAQMRVSDSEAITGRVHALHQYEKVVDLDEMISSNNQQEYP